MNETIHYRYVHRQTEATTGYFACRPEPLPAAPELLALLAERPLDSFLRRHALGVFAALSAEELQTFLRSAPESDAEAVAALRGFWAELALAAPALRPLLQDRLDESGADAVDSSPLLYLRRAALTDAPLHAAWAAIFHANVHGHRKLAAPDELAAQGLPPLFSREILEEFAAPPALTLADLAGSSGAEDSPGAAMSAEEVAELALDRLRAAGAVAGAEQRHIASLSPIALLLPWRLDIEVREGRNRHSLRGQANTYGRGLSLPQARASCRMEMVERFSAYLSIRDGVAPDLAARPPLLRARRSALLERGEAALDPNDFYIEAPYQDQELVWLPARQAVSAGVYRPVWAPLQLAALFSNCDEIDLTSAPGSTGLATGQSPEQARLAALTEIIERDSEATVPYSKDRCFRLDPSAVRDEALAALLRDYAALGVNLQFLDLTGPLGLPCYQAFVIGPKGSLHRGHGAGLSGPRALLSAITETPYPYPEGGPSGPLLRKLPVRRLEDLPDFSSGSLQGDLARLETLLCANGLHPVYVDLTHRLLKFPVVRALVPGLQPSADFDDFTRLSPRLYANYLNIYK